MSPEACTLESSLKCQLLLVMIFAGLMCDFFDTGIFGYLNYLLPRSQKFILETLIKGLQRLEYRGYDSAGIAYDSDTILEDGSSLHKTE